MDLKSYYNKHVKILDQYVLRHVAEIFIMGVIIFSSIVFASQAFFELLKKISDFGLPPKYAFMIIILNLPTVFVKAIPMSMLLATIMGVNKLCLSSELTVMRACGIGINRVAKPIFVFAALMTLLSLGINEFISPFMGSQSKTLLIWALGQKNIPDGKKNYTLKEMSDGNVIRRFFYVQSCTKKQLENVSVIDFSDEDQTQIVQASKGETANEGWVFKNASVYTIDENGKLMNTSWVNKTTVDFGIEAKEELSKVSAEEFTFKQLLDYIKNTNIENEKLKRSLQIQLHEKITFPVTTIVLTFIGIPLAITPPRARFNRGFIMSILVILVFYIIEAIAAVLGESGTITPFFAAWTPNILFAIVGYIIYRNKAYKIS